MNKKQIGKRIEALLLKKNGGNQSEMARYIGVKPQAVQQWISGETTPRGNNMIKAAEFLNSTPSYIQFGDGNIEDFDVSGKIPLISWVQAGSWCEAIDNFAPGDAEDWILCPFKHGESTFALKVRGESMFNPTGDKSFKNGDIIYVDPKRDAVHGSLVVVRQENEKEATFKRLLIDGDKKMLEALNPSWPNRIIQINGDATICGVVFGKYEKI